jgi:hypothetical protein
VDHVQGLASVFGKLLHSLDGPEAEPPHNGQASIAESGQRLRSVATPGPTGIFAKGHIAMTMKEIFDRPMVPCQGEQLSGARAAAWQAGDGMDNFNRGLAFHGAFPRDPADLGRARPVDVARHQP